jgi:hypothetical protein
MLENLSQEDKSKLILNQEALERTKQEQLQNKETSPEAIQKKIQDEIQKIETYSEQITDIPEYQEKQIESLGGNEQELADEMATIDAEIKRTKSGFFDRTKNYVIGLMAMVASTGNVAASTKQEVKNPDNVTFQKPTVKDSLDLYKNTISLRDYYLKGGKYQKTEEKKIEKGSKDVWTNINNGVGLFDLHNNGEEYGITHPTFFNFMTNHSKLNAEDYKKTVDSNKFLQREGDVWVLDTRAPMHLYDKRITPTLKTHYINKDKKDIMYGDDIDLYDYDPVLIKPVSMLTKAEKIERYKKYGEKSGIPNPNNKTPEPAKKTTTVAPKKETKTTVELKKNANDVTKDSIRTKIKAESVAPKKETIKTNKVETKKDKIIYVEDKNDPRLKIYEESLKVYNILNPLFKKQFPAGTPLYANEYSGASEEEKKDIDKATELFDLYDSVLKREKWKSIVGITKSTYGTYYPNQPKKPTVEVKYRPKQKLTEVGLKPIDAVKIPTEQTEANPLANLKQKEVIKNPEKTGYTVRVGEKLYYLSKEDLNKLESDKTTHYNVSEKGDGTEKRLVWWGGNDQGQNLQQVAERLGIKLPRAFDTQRQEFDK